MNRDNKNILALKHQANMHLQSNQLHKALDLYLQIYQLNSKDPEALCSIGMINGQLGNFKEAEVYARKALKIKPGHGGAHFILASALHALGNYKEAVTHFKHASRAIPNNPGIYNNLGNTLAAQGDINGAIHAYQEAIKLQPNFPEAFNNFGSAFLSINKLHAAMQNFREAVRLNPDFTEAYNNLGTALQKLGMTTEALDQYRKAIQLQPTHAKAHSNLVYLLAASTSLPPDKMLEELRYWDKIHGKEGRAHPLSKSKRRAIAGRRLRIGYVSSDLRRHAVSYFFEPLLAAHDRNHFEIFCYASVANVDATTERLRDLAEHWRYVFGKSDAALAQLIHEDDIDILVDLSGHTAQNRLKAFTYRPAPLQATYLGFFSATGLETMDYWITDEVLHPSNTPEQTIEHIYRLPRCSFCYQPPAEAPAVSPCPNSDNHVVFGSFNNLSKLTPEVYETWSQLLHGLPESRLLLMDMPLTESKTRQLVFQRFAHHDISPERLILQQGAPFTQYLTTYAEIDIVLDPFPRTGGTTTAEALWMGLPVITLAGQRYVERISASKLVAVGLEDLITYSRKEYLDKAASLAHDPPGRAELRATIRERMAQSPLCDGKGLAHAMESAYQTMWKQFLVVPRG